MALQMKSVWAYNAPPTFSERIGASRALRFGGLRFRVLPPLSKPKAPVLDDGDADTVDQNEVKK